jgi:hypothetical protein
MKRRYRADLLRTLANEDNMIVIMERTTVLDAIYGASRTWSSVNAATLVRSRRKLLPDLEEDDLQGFCNEEISKSEILDLMCAMRSFERVDEKNIED